MLRILSFIAVMSLLGGCAGVRDSDPLADVPQISTEEATEGSVALQAAPGSGFLSGLFAGRATASPPDITEDAAVAAEPSSSSGLFGGLFTRAAAGQIALAQTDAVPPMTQLPFGEVGVTCGLSGSERGTKIASAAGFTIYDTRPNTTAPRPHYITGFDDGCARQFTAALVLTGDVGTHEVVRYQTAQASRPYTTVDNAYEAIKAGFCRAGHGKPCGRRINALGRQAVFVTGYERFGTSPVWVEILLYDGELVASGVERQ